MELELELELELEFQNYFKWPVSSYSRKLIGVKLSPYLLQDIYGIDEAFDSIRT